MAPYKISFKPSVEKDLKSLPKAFVPKILKKIEKLATDPSSVRALKLSNAEKLFRIRVGNYRIIYELDQKSEEIIIHYVRHRSTVYRKV